ncbi:2OG-Fe(II) oxygenase [Micromonospora coerulea]|uniref:2OG-Fe(II) oxygenase n=1 Tax=Micromonospora coerulea TaxID=47856 RepID=UPI0019061E12|nr:2OG-Fe(II) oxygenase [Micromonospora veneta]
MTRTKPRSRRGRPDRERGRESPYDRFGGYAATTEAHRLGIASATSDPHRPDAPPSCSFTWWCPPDRFALDAPTCGQLVDLAERGVRRDDVAREPWRATAYALPGPVLGDQLADQVFTPAEVANELWWRLAIGIWHAELKRYDTGHSHPEHADLGPSSMGRKLAMSVQLSDPGRYEGGDLQLRLGGHWITAPRERGTIVAFPAWIVHRVTPVTRGTRWSLIVTGAGEPIR